MLGRALVLCAALSCCAHPHGAAGGERAPVDRSETLPVDGAALWLLTRGADRTAPILLWLHGGPGGAETPLFRLYDGALEQSFVVAYWDQRGAGRSFDPDADPRALTIARHLADLGAVVDHLRAALGQERVALVGHSFGSALGLLYARAHPEKVSAVVGVAQVTSIAAAQESEHDFVDAEATQRRDADALARLDEIGASPYSAAAEQVLESLTGRYGGLYHRQPSFAWASLRAISFGYTRPWEISRFIRANEVTLAAMNAELSAFDLRRSVTRVGVPVAFFLGRWDRHVDAELAAKYLDALEAPAKRLVWFEQSAHNVPFEEPELFVSQARAVLDAFGVASSRGRDGAQ